MRLLALPLFAAVASSGWALRESRVPSELTAPAVAPVSPAPSPEAVVPPPRVVRREPARAAPALPQVAIVRGRVVEDGEPVADYEVGFYRERTDISVTTDEQGEFELVLVPGDYVVETNSITRLVLAPGQILDGWVLSLDRADEGEEEPEPEAASQEPAEIIE